MVGHNGGIFKMNKLKSYLPDKLFGKDVAVWLVWSMPVGVMIILMLIFARWVVPQIIDIKGLFNQIDKVVNETKVLNEKRVYLLSLDRAELESKLTLIENGVLSEENSYLLVKIISKIGADFEYQVSDFSVTLGDIKEVAKKSTKFEYQTVPVDVVIVGPKANFLAMINAVEKSLPVLSIDNYSMTITGDLATIKMSILAYYLPEWTQNKLEALSLTDLTSNNDELTVLSKIDTYKYYGVTEGEIKQGVQKFVPSDRVDPFY